MPARKARPGPLFLAPVLTGRRAAKYFVLALIWAVAAGFFWGWWLRPEYPS